MSEVTLGGDRLGSGNKQKIHLENYGRSNQNLSFGFKTTISPGTRVPFMSEVVLPGDSFDIDLDADMLTVPTVGPLFGSFKLQIDLFHASVRMYQAQLHMNKLGIGNRMQTILLPQMELIGKNVDMNKPDINNQQIAASCIFKYLGISGLGSAEQIDPTPFTLRRRFNAVPWLAYWEIYKNYYANKQEEVGYVVHNAMTAPPYDMDAGTLIQGDGRAPTFPLTYVANGVIGTEIEGIFMNTGRVYTKWDLGNLPEPSLMYISVNGIWKRLVEMYSEVIVNVAENTIVFNGYLLPSTQEMTGFIWIDTAAIDVVPKLQEFQLDEIDEMREYLLTNPNGVTITNSYGDGDNVYQLPLRQGQKGMCMTSEQEGLGVKTYQSDLFNNWISTEWLDGNNGVNAVSAVQITDDQFTIDELNLSKKIYMMLNRIALSGGSYDDWLDAAYTSERMKSMESPVFVGGMSKELVFQEIVSNSATGDQPLGTLAGMGRLKGGKGGKVHMKASEHGYIIGIVSLTPRIEYSQGNKWDMNLKTMDDFHKPGLDQIGFQDLITDQMAFWDTRINIEEEVTYKSLGKQPAWINYTTNVDVVRGNFAKVNDSMFMVLNRRYEAEVTDNYGVQLKDGTTYIDPSKYNYIFANTRLDAMNFWLEIDVKNIVRRQMSAKQIPNL